MRDGEINYERVRKNAIGFFTHLFLILVSLSCLFPLWWAFASSLKTQGTVFNDLSLFPANPRWQNYYDAWTKADFGTYFFNSLLYTTAVVTGVVVIASMAAYAFSRLRFFGRNVLFYVLISTLMIPIPGSFVALYVLLNKLHLVNTRLGYILPQINAGLALGIFLLKTFFDELPKDLEDSAAIDGCGPFRTYWHIALPLVRPVLGVLIIFTILAVWNEYLLAMIVFADRTLMPVQRGLMVFQGVHLTQYPLLMAGIVITTLPVLLVYLLLHRHIIKGIARMAFVWALIFFSQTAAYAAGNDGASGGTRLLNSHGENMELEFKLSDPGSGDIVDYQKFGSFTGEGTGLYEYRMTKRKALAAETGEGVYPNNSVYKDPAYRMLVTRGRLAGSQWDYVNIDNPQLAFYKWAATNDTPAVQQFYTAVALERVGETLQAIKAYYAVLVHFPKGIGWTYFRTPLYMGRLAIDKIEYLTRKHPELGVKLQGARIRVANGYNTVVTDDQFTEISPGRLVKVRPAELKPKKADLKKLAITKTVGTGAVQLVRYENGHWQMLVDGKPFMVKAVAYNATPAGMSPHSGYDLNLWMTNDQNHNGRIDGPFDAWVDANKNNRQDPDEKPVGDFELMKRMGVNVIRLYHHGMNKELLRRLYKDYGIRVIMGDFLGMYAVGSKAEWFAGTDYTDPRQLENMRRSVREMVSEHKDEPYVLMWMLGNESNYGEPGVIDEPGKPGSGKAGFGSRAKFQSEAHYAFVNETAGMIKEMDPTRPVGFSNGEVITIDILSRHSDNIDVFGVNAYRGSQGFGRSFWEDARDWMDRPVLVTEYGCPAYYSGKPLAFAEEKQKEYHQGNWEDIWANRAGWGRGNAIGGVAFEFVDEWWKAGPPPQFDAFRQETKGDFQANFPDGWMYEEWLGIAGQGDGSDSPFLRQLRSVYDYYQQAWNITGE